MQKEIVLAPEELYYLGRFLQAKYIDYAYVASMNSIDRSFALFEQETKAALVSSGVLAEDFGGDIEMDKNVKSILMPIFFGETETSLDICAIGETKEENKVTVYKFHFLDRVVTMVTNDNGKLAIKPVDLIGIHQIAENLLPEGYNAEHSVIEEEIEVTVSRYIAAKSITFGKTSTVKSFVEANSVIYKECGEQVESLSGDMVVSDIYETIKGE